MNYFPLTAPFFWLLGGLLLLAVALIQIEALRFAYQRLGIGPITASMLLIASFFGSYINLPVYALPAEEIVSGRVVDFFGMRYVVPSVVDWPQTIIAVNVGGAVIPVLLSFYLLTQARLVRAAIATAVVAAVCYRVATLVPGLGIAIPSLVPPLVTTLVAVLIAPRDAAATAYISGSLGTLIGADLMNLPRIRGLGAPIVSIGGAGTFDGIFITGLAAVLLASLVARRSQMEAR